MVSDSLPCFFREMNKIQKATVSVEHSDFISEKDRHVQSCSYINFSHLKLWLMLGAETFQMQRLDYKSTSSDLSPCGECLLFTFQFLCTRGTRQMQGKTAALPSHVSLQSALS